MKRCKTHLVRVCLVVLVSVPAYCQRGTFGIDIGQTSDKFDSLSSVSGLEFGIDGQMTVLKSNAKQGRPSLVAGGEIRLPNDTADHAREYALFAGTRIKGRELSIGFNVRVWKIVLPSSPLTNEPSHRP